MHSLAPSIMRISCHYALLKIRQPTMSSVGGEDTSFSPSLGFPLYNQAE